MAKKKSTRGSLRLPVQVLNWGEIPGNTKKIFFQFEVSVYSNGTKKFGLVAYPASRSGQTWKISRKILLQTKPGRLYKLPIPITLGNLELGCEEFMGKLDARSKLYFTPKLYSKNAHASYLVDDGTTQYRDLANPSPPASPYY